MDQRAWQLQWTAHAMKDQWVWRSNCAVAHVVVCLWALQEACAWLRWVLRQQVWQIDIRISRAEVCARRRGVCQETRLTCKSQTPCLGVPLGMSESLIPNGAPPLNTPEER